MRGTLDVLLVGSGTIVEEVAIEYFWLLTGARQRSSPRKFGDGQSPRLINIDQCSNALVYMENVRRNAASW